jgi:DNA-binding transcriptional MocR family regulator
MSERINPYRLFVGSFLPNWLLSRPEISMNAKVVYARLGQYAGRDGDAFPLLQTLADEVGLSLTTLKRALDELKEHKLIETEQRGLGQSNLYFFLRHKWMSRDRTDARRKPADGLTESPPAAFQESPQMGRIRESDKENQLKIPASPPSYFDKFKKWEELAAKDPSVSLSEMAALKGGRKS